MEDRQGYLVGQRLTERQKRADGKKWFKENIDRTRMEFDGRFYPSEFNEDTFGRFEGDYRYRDMKINYDLYDGKIQREDFKYIYAPYGGDMEQPVDFTNKDIIGKRINAIDGMERQRQFSFRVNAINPEASTRREDDEFNMIREFVIQQIMKPIEEEERQKAEQQIGQAQMQLQQLQASGASQEEIQQAQQQMQQAQQQLEQQVQQQVEARTPEQVKLYMKREHQDPADVLGSQILQYVRHDQDVKEKWNLINKDFCCVGRAIGYVGERYKKTVFERVNPLTFRFSRSGSSHYIEDGEWCSYERYLTPSEVTMEFGDELSDKDMKDLLNGVRGASDTDYYYRGYEKRDSYVDGGIRCIHAQWKDSKKIGFLTYMDENGEEQMTIVSDEYKMNPDAGDIDIEWEWVACVYEGYKLGADKYVKMREVPGQFDDINNLNNREKCKLSYVGVWVDSSLIDRMRYYQFLYSIIWYRIEMLMAKDKGKSVGMNIDMVDDNMGLQKFLEYAENVGIFFFSGNTKEGDKASPMNIGESIKEVDRGMGSDIKQYMDLAEYIDIKCGECVGINQQILGNVQQNEAVTNAQMAVTNGATVLEHHFSMFNHFKQRTLQAMIECAKDVFMKYQPEVVQYVLDDFTVELLKPDYDLLDQSTYGIVIDNSVKSNQILDTVVQLIQPAMQNQKIELSDVVKVLKAESVQEAEEILLKAEDDRKAYEQQVQQQQAQNEQEAQRQKLEAQMQLVQAQNQAKMEQIRLQGEYDLRLKEMDLQRQTLLALGFSDQKDLNENKVPDVYEYMKMMLEQYKSNQKDRELDQKERKQRLDEESLAHKKDFDDKKLQLEKEKIQKMAQKSKNS